MIIPIARLAIVAFAAATTLIAALAQADEHPGLDLAFAATPVVSGTADGELSGPYGPVYQALLSALEGPAPSWAVIPPSRAYRGFENDVFLCVSPDSRVYYDPERRYIDTEPIATVRWLAVTPPGAPLITRRADLAGKRVGTIYDPESLRPVLPRAGAIYDVAPSEKSNLEKLRLGRLDAVVIDSRDLRELVAANPGLKSLSYDFQEVIARTPDAIMCHDTPSGRDLVRRVNAAMERLGRPRIRALLSAAQDPDGDRLHKK